MRANYLKQDCKCLWCGRQFTYKTIKRLEAVSLPLCSVSCLEYFLKKIEPVKLPDYSNCFLYKPKDKKPFRSSADARFFNWARFEGIEAWYEPFIFDIQTQRKRIQYIPDFYLPDSKIFIEIKYNEFSSKAINKINAFKEIGFCIFVIDLAIYRIYPSIIFKKGFVR